MIKVLQAVDSWAAEFERAHVYASPHGPLVPKVNIGSIQGGAPFRPNYYPGVCSIYVDVRTPPELRPVQVQRELKSGSRQARRRIRDRNVRLEDGLRGQTGRIGDQGAGRKLSIAVRQKDPDTDRSSREHLDGHQYLQRDGHSGMQVRSSAADAGSFARSKSRSRTSIRRRRFMLAQRWKFATGTSREISSGSKGLAWKIGFAESRAFTDSI